VATKNSITQRHKVIVPAIFLINQSQKLWKCPDKMFTSHAIGREREREIDKESLNILPRKEKEKV